MTPHHDKQFSVVPPSNSLVSVLDPEGLFELTWHSSRALVLDYICGTTCNQGLKDRCVVLSTEIPEHRQEQLMQTLIVHLLKFTFLH